MAQPIILVANDQQEIVRPICFSLEDQYPEAEIRYCKTVEECFQQFTDNANSITMVILDQDMGCDYSGSMIAEKLRAGAYGTSLKTVPIVICSGDPHPKEMQPPIAYVAYGRNMDEVLSDYVKRYAFGGGGDVVSAFTEQDNRNAAARKLIGCFPPYPMPKDDDAEAEKLFEKMRRKEITIEEYYTALDNLTAVRQFTDQNQYTQVLPDQEIHASSRARYEYMRSLLEAAFDGGQPTHTPRKEATYPGGLLIELILAVDRDKYYMGADDSYTNRYVMLKSDIRSKALEALIEVSPTDAANYVSKQR